MQNYIIAGIGTEIGKTIASAILTEYLQSDYWKPIQSGSIENTDSQTVKTLISNSKTVFHPEAYLLKEPLSPHAAADLENIEIVLDKIALPQSTNRILVEMAGGVMTPINHHQTNLDLIKKLDLPIILVIKNYLGSINHSMLTIKILQANGINIKGLIFNGEVNHYSEKFIVENTQLPVLAHFPHLSVLSSENIFKLVQNLDLKL